MNPRTPSNIYAASLKNTLALIFCSCAASIAAATPPNVLVIIADDQGWGDLGVHGNTNLQTPHLDALARAGASFDFFFVQPVCSPTRAEFLTGRYHPRGGVRGVTTGGERLDLDETTIAGAFLAAGYKTACFGKWHHGSQYPYHPNGRGFEEFYGFTSGHWGHYFDPPLDHNGQLVRGDGYLPDDLTTRAIDFMRQQHSQQRPFFCLLAFNTPHSPMQVPERYWRGFEHHQIGLRGSQPNKEHLPHTRAALAMCENLDDNVRRLLKALNDFQAADETIVVYFSDNGPNGARWNAGMKGMKGSTDEGGVRSPLFLRWPGKIRPGTTIRSIAGAIDLYPTLASLAGIAPIAEKPLDGIDLSPVLLATDVEPRDRVLFNHWAGKTSARSQTHRLDANGRLYHILDDPGQLHDLSEKDPAVAAQLRSSVEQWRKDVLAELSAEDDRPFPVGHRARPSATLPARDGWPHGAVKRSARAPNCSYFTNWTSSQDRMTWDVEIATAGRYEARLAYTCPADDIGSSIELTLGAAKWSGVIRIPHNPPLQGQEQDRVPRVGESYVKDFRMLDLGIAELAPGRNVLTLRATKIPGKHVADIESVTLIRRELGR
jgi:arylsulfatase A-like enzyme